MDRSWCFSALRRVARCTPRTPPHHCLLVRREKKKNSFFIHTHTSTSSRIGDSFDIKYKWTSQLPSVSSANECKQIWFFDALFLTAAKQIFRENVYRSCWHHQIEGVCRQIFVTTFRFIIKKKKKTEKCVLRIVSERKSFRGTVSCVYLFIYKRICTQSSVSVELAYACYNKLFIFFSLLIVRVVFVAIIN